MELEVRVERLGAQGDGVAQGPEGSLFVPFTLPGELVTVAAEPGATHADPLAILEPSPDRVAPVCPHFGTCGGCALQHMESQAYLAWKREQVIAALRSRGSTPRWSPCGPCRSRAGGGQVSRLLGRGKAFPLATAPHARTPSSTSPPARCSARALWRACPSLRLCLRRFLAASVKRASPSRKPIRASMWP